MRLPGVVRAALDHDLPWFDPRLTAFKDQRHIALKKTDDVVDYFIRRFTRVPPNADKRQALISFLSRELGTSDISVAKTYMEDSLRLLLHLMMSEPEYQLS